MLVRGRVVGAKGVATFEILKDRKGISLKVELPGKPLVYSTDCHCLEPLELLGLFLPALEEELGEIKGVFVEEVSEKREGEGKFHSLLKSLRRFLSNGGHTTP